MHKKIQEGALRWFRHEEGNIQRQYVQWCTHYACNRIVGKRKTEKDVIWKWGTGSCEKDARERDSASYRHITIDIIRGYFWNFPWIFEIRGYSNIVVWKNQNEPYQSPPPSPRCSDRSLIYTTGARKNALKHGRTAVAAYGVHTILLWRVARRRATCRPRNARGREGHWRRGE